MNAHEEEAKRAFAKWQAAWAEEKSLEQKLAAAQAAADLPGIDAAYSALMTCRNKVDLLLREAVSSLRCSSKNTKAAPR